MSDKSKNDGAEKIAKLNSQQTRDFLLCFDPEFIKYREETEELRKNCPSVIYCHDMNATIEYCKIYGAPCEGQCRNKT